MRSNTTNYMDSQNDKARIAFIDIETAPSLGYVWGKWEQDVIQFTKHWYILGFAVKWFGAKGVETVMLPDFRGYESHKEDDSKLVKELWKVFDEADVIVAHYGDGFDVPKSNARFVAHGLPPPSPYKTIDTKKVAKRYFRFDSNKLDEIAQYLKLGKKLPTGGFETWQGCMTGDKKAWAKMREYNAQDVVLLEKIYLTLRPWMTNHPNLNIYDEQDMACPICKSKKLQRRGYRVTTVGKRQSYQCQSCGGWSQGAMTGARVAIR